MDSSVIHTSGTLQSALCKVHILRFFSDADLWFALVNTDSVHKSRFLSDLDLWNIPVSIARMVIAPGRTHTWQAAEPEPMNATPAECSPG